MTRAGDAPPEGLLVEQRGLVLVVTLNRPERGNALTPVMHDGMRRLWAEVRDDDGIRCVVITGAGDRHFCTGTDLLGVAERGTTNAGDGPLRESVFWTSRHNEVWKPTICAVNGVAAGGGLHFVVDADIVVASATATFLDTHVDVGMVGAIENIGLAQRLPLGAALRMTLQGKRYRMPADRAYALGLVDELVPAEDLLETALAIASDVAEGSPAAIAGSMQAIWGSLGVPYDEALERGWRLVRDHWAHPDFVEGPRAFAERRPPRWTTVQQEEAPR